MAAITSKKENKLVMLDVGGRDEPSPDILLENLDFISPNETELARLMNVKDDVELTTKFIRENLLNKYKNLVVVLKLGARGSQVITSEIDIM